MQHNRKPGSLSAAIDVALPLIGTFQMAVNKCGEAWVQHEKKASPDDGDREALRTAWAACDSARNELLSGLSTIDEGALVLARNWNPSEQVRGKLRDVRRTARRLHGAIRSHENPFESPFETPDTWENDLDLLIELRNNDVALYEAEYAECPKKRSGVKWQMAQKRMVGLLQKGKLPKTLQQAKKLLESEGFRYNTIRTAAHKSPSLAGHFKLDATGDALTATGGEILDELAQQADQRTKRAIRSMSPQQRAKVEAELKDMPAADALELVKTLAHDPDAGSTGDVAYIEEADQDDRDDDE